MKDKGIILPIPKKKYDVTFDELSGPRVGFQLNFDVDEYITIAQAAAILGVSPKRMAELVENLHIKKYEDTGDRYLLSMADIMGLGQEQE